MTRLSVTPRELSPAHAEVRRPWSAGTRQHALSAVVIATFLASVAETYARPHGMMEPSLAHLLQLMAVIKGAVALGAFALVRWRLGRATGWQLTAAYAAACALMAAAPAMIWQRADIVAAALMFHGGLLLLLGLAYYDRDAATDLLGASMRRSPARRQGRP